MNLEEELEQLIEEACKHPPGSLQRQQNLTKIIRLTGKKLWRENTPYYQDILQRTWQFFCENVCEGKTGSAYDRNKGSLITWLNYYLKGKLKSAYIARQKQQTRIVDTTSIISRSGETEEIINPIEQIPASPDLPPILERVREWVEKDPSGELTKVHIEGYPQIDCQTIILKRLPPETSWKELAEEFNLSISTLSSFYQRQCLPRLRNFGKSEGYI
jgi:hypothetical protein